MRILVIQLRAIGDVLCATPVVSYLKQVLPDASVDFLVEPVSRSLIETHPGLNEVLVYDKTRGWNEIKRVRSKRYDAVLDFMNNPRTAYLTAFSGARWRVGFRRSVRTLAYNVPVSVPEEPEYVPKRRIRMADAWLSGMGISSQTPATVRPALHLSEEDEQHADQWIKKENLEGKKFVVLMPVHKHAICRWRPEGFRSVGLNLAQSGYRVYVAWGPGEETLAQEIRAGHENVLLPRPPDDLRKFAAVLKRSALLLANNSGSMHLAVSVGTPTVTIYGPTRAIDWNPSLAKEADNGNDLVVEAADVACLGCRLKDCPVGHLCMTHLDERTVLNACRTLLNRVR